MDSEKLTCFNDGIKNKYFKQSTWLNPGFKTNYFKQSSWFYPGQKCNQMMLSFSEREYKIIQNKHIYSVSYNEGINYTITDFKGLSNDTIEDNFRIDKNYMIELEKLCNGIQEDDKKKIIIVSGCRSCHGNPDIFREFKFENKFEIISPLNEELWTKLFSLLSLPCSFKTDTFRSFQFLDSIFADLAFIVFLRL